MKEHKDKPARGRFSHHTWLEKAMPSLVDGLCMKLGQSNARVEFEDRKQFCTEYADLVIDQRKVTTVQRRVRDLDLVLTAAVRDGRVVIRNAFYGRALIIELSPREQAMQDAAALAREAEQQYKWRERRRAKGR